MGDRTARFHSAQKNGCTEYRATLENAIHMVDLMRWICGDAWKSCIHQFSDPHYETSCVAHIRFARASAFWSRPARAVSGWSVSNLWRGEEVIADAPDG